MRTNSTRRSSASTPLRGIFRSTSGRTGRVEVQGELVVPRKRIAILYKQYLDEIGIVSSEVLITSPDTREGGRSVRRDLERGGGLLEAHDG